MCSKCSSLMPYDWVCNKSKTTCGIWTVSLPEHPSSPLEVSGVFVARSLVFCVMLCPFVIFLSVIVLSFLLMSCDYPFCIFKLFLLHVCHQCLRWNWWINKSNFLLIVSKQKQYLFNCYNKLYFAKCIHLIMLFNVSDRYNINLRTSIH